MASRFFRCGLESGTASADDSFWMVSWSSTESGPRAVGSPVLICGTSTWPVESDSFQPPAGHCEGGGNQNMETWPLPSEAVNMVPGASCAGQNEAASASPLRIAMQCKTRQRFIGIIGAPKRLHPPREFQPSLWHERRAAQTLRRLGQ